MWLPKTSRSTGKVYYYNIKTRETSWKKPPEHLIVQENKKSKNAQKKSEKKKKVQSSFMRRDPVDVPKCSNEEKVAKAYNEMTKNAKKVSRQNTKNIRAWNNLVKRSLIRQSIFPPGYFYGIKVLDLTCGRGGDMGKILQYEHVKRYRGIDISDDAVQEAIKRSALHNKYHAILDFACMDMNNTDAQFNYFNDLEKATTCGDRMYDPTYKILELNEPYDFMTKKCHTFSVINMQYSLHYFCKTKKQLTALIKKIAECLNTTGKWIGTLPCSDRIQDAVNGKYPVPPFCEIKPAKRWKGNGRFGDPYTFYLEDCVPCVEEYLCPKQILCDIAKKCGLHNVYFENAGIFLKDTVKKYKDDEWQDDIPYGFLDTVELKYYKQDVPIWKEDLDWQVTSLYNVFVFQKTL